ncbi:NYN domain-containing protein [Alicyclobacillus mali]|uniref:NYN domain-containing protein n=1 Tax=Alicyclobacillus mali (ex Roth et al. 2021) TaxID=1123961 RepID=A0ABS0F6Z6_9BACL|nr:NYN domain-containing protein [Alicyclobacillus mali (ex Roth et al. 2021)]MBF8379043.1 NYN domain-containing protein [Alicyclobacillus mali (ex Roth et al. 2021)]MCL6488403.1 NYN domain-containing protein [Alicyclobacillus mali (ex Roth et al. 2021)]
MRVSLFVDGANYYYMQRDKLKWTIDAQKLLEWAKGKGELVDAFYYIGRSSPSDVREQKYLDMLAYSGYSIVTKDIKEIVQEDGSITRKANLDIEIVLDMFNTIDNYDMAILVSGDGDFERALQLLRARGKKFIVLSTAGFIASELRMVAGMHFIDVNTLRDQLERVMT